MKTQTFTYENEFQLEARRKLARVEIAYTTIGRLNSRKDNVIWVTHALTANSNPEEWWNGLVGKGKYFNPDEHFIICANIVGSCYGSTGPLSANPENGSPYYHDFPEITIRDIVKGLELLRSYLKIEHIHTLVGASMGGQQALEWAIQQPSLVANLILIATNAQHSPWGKAFNESQRLAITSDRSWYSYSADAGLKGLKTARSIALLSYRNYETYQLTQQDDIEQIADFNAPSYQNYQGEKLINRFNAFSYWVLSKAMDSHNVGRRRGTIKNALSRVKANTLIIAISSDILFPIAEAKVLNEGIKKSSCVVIDSLYGHDGFLIETERIERTFKKFYEEQNLINKKVKHLNNTIL